MRVCTACRGLIGPASADASQARLPRLCGRGVGPVRWPQSRDVLDRYLEALGGRLSLMADFGDDLLRVG